MGFMSLIENILNTNKSGLFGYLGYDIILVT